MKNEKAIASGVILALTLLFLASTCTASTIYVPDEYSAMQEAVNAASIGDTIIVRDGTYIENIEVDKSLTIRSEKGIEYAIVRAKNSYKQVFKVTADYVEISGFTVEGATDSDGIHLYYADYCNITNNKCSNNSEGIYLLYSDNNSLSNNKCSNNSEGIRISLFSDNNSMLNNICSNNRHFGIIIDNSYDNSMLNNICSNSEYGIYLVGSNNSIMSNNCSDNNKSIYLLGFGNNTISNNNCSNNGFCIYLLGSDNNRISNNDCSKNSLGIHLSRSNNNHISNNNCSKNTFGIFLCTSDNNGISNNNCSNGAFGIFLDTSDNNGISNNICSNNVFEGISLDYSNNNIIYFNNFMDNAKNVRSYGSTNAWNSNEKITYTGNKKTYENYLGNYWSDYTGTDKDADCIGDTPYRIDRDKDNYPLMEPWEKYFRPMLEYAQTKENTMLAKQC